MSEDIVKEISDSDRAEFQQEMQSGLEQMMFEVKKKLKGNSKNELIRICCALLVENYSLKQGVQIKEQEKSNETA